ncbi:MAG: MOP flippase family protein [Richelia sp. RM2_1_2]|nr:MOP flippase family protein [Richelia sp. RM1_1_1]NJO58655.1 MOP flippase family protein [Richelia sp. RM2_1_2]
MSLRQKAFQGVIWSVIESWGSRIISVSIFFLLARLLDPKAFGIVALASVFIDFVQLFIDQGFSQAIIQRENLEQEHLNSAFWINLGIGLLLTILTLSFADFIANGFNEPALTPVIRWLSVGFLLSSLSKVQEAILQRELNFKALASRSLFASVISGIVGVTMAFMGWGVWSLVSKLLIFAIIQTILVWWVSDWRPTFKVSLAHFKDIFSFAINILGWRIFNFLNRRSDDFLIGYFLGTTALGYYNIAYRLLIMITELLVGVSQRVAMPAFSRLQAEPQRLRNAFYKVTQFTSLISFPIFLGIAALAPQLIRLSLGEAWNQSVPIMQILAFAGILHSISDFNDSIMFAVGKPSWNLKFKVLSSVVTLSCFFVAVRWGIVAVSLAYVISSYLLYPISIWLVYKLIKLDPKKYVEQFKVSFFATVFMVSSILGFQYMIANSINMNMLLSVSLSSIIGLFVYLLSVYLIQPSLIKKIIKMRTKP